MKKKEKRRGDSHENRENVNKDFKGLDMAILVTWWKQNFKSPCFRQTLRVVEMSPKKKYLGGEKVDE